MGVVRSLMTRFGFRVDSGKLQSANAKIGKTKVQLKLAAREARNFRKSLNMVSFAAQGMAAAFLGSRVIKLFTEDYAKAADEAAKFAKATGISVESYQALTHATALSGGETADLQKTLQQLNKRATEAALDGNKTLKRTFKDIGVELKGTNGKLKGTEQLFLELSDQFKKMPPGARKTGRAMQLFGRTGAKMLVLMDEGSDGIKKMMQEARELGLVLSKKAAKDAENYNDEMLRSKSVLIGLRNMVAGRLLPALTKNARKFQLWARQAGNMRKLLDRLTIAAKLTAAALALMVSAKIVGGFQMLAGVITSGVSALRAMGTAALAAQVKVALIPIAIVAIALAIQDLYFWIQGKDSLTGRIFGKAPQAELAGVRRALAVTGKWLAKAGRALLEVGRDIVVQWNILRIAGAKLWDEFGDDLTDLGRALGKFAIEIWKNYLLINKAIRRAMIRLGQILVMIWRQVAPAVKDAIVVFRGLWTTVKPWIAWIIDKQRRWNELMSDMAGRIAPWVGKAIAGSIRTGVFMIKMLIRHLTLVITMVTLVVRAFRAAAKFVGKAWDATFGRIIGGVDKVLSKVSRIPGVGSLVSNLSGGPSVSLSAALPKTPTASGAGAGNNVQVGTLAVNVQGQTNMTEAQILSAITTGAKKVLQDSLTGTYGDRAPVTP